MDAEIHVADRELLRRTREGDADAFATFYRARNRAVLAYLRVRVPSAELATDLMCETFTQALVVVHDRSRELPVVPIAWFLTIARNELIDSIRRGRVSDTTRRGSRWNASSCPTPTSRPSRMPPRTRTCSRT
jgi:DNA-directed RNA polymerase specialized sigma24 family protein